MRRIAYGTLLVWTLCLGSTAWGRAKTTVFVPDAAASSSQLDGNVWAVDAEHFVARLVLLDEPTRQQWLLRQTGSATDPFATTPGAPPSFLTFLLDLQCRGDGKIYFEPIGSRLITSDGDLRNPLDLPSVQSAFGTLERKLPPSYEGILNRVLLQKQVDLAPGARATGLIAFRIADMKLRRFRLELSVSGPNGEAIGFEAPYVAVKTDAPADRP